MGAECCVAKPRGSSKRSLAALAALAPAGLLLFAVPKCPVCLLAYFGLGTALLGGVLDAARGVLLAGLFVAAIALGVRARRRASARARG